MKTMRFISVIWLFSLCFTLHAETLSGPVPQVPLQTLDGKPVSINQYRGQVVLVNFFASWCGPCRLEMPVLDQLHKRYKNIGFTVLGITVDEEVAAAKHMLKEIPVTFPVTRDATGEAMTSYNVQAMPTTVLVDRKGNMRFLHKGYQPGFEDDYEKQIKALLKE